MQIKEVNISVPFRKQETIAKVTLYSHNPGKSTLVCLHGIGSTGRETFDNLAEVLACDMPMLAIDWIGFGDSSRLLGTRDTYNLEYCAEWMQLCFDSLQREGLINNFSILAHSMSALPVAYSFEYINRQCDAVIFSNPAGLDTHIKRSFAFFLTSNWINHHKIARILVNRILWRRLIGWSERHRQRLISGLDNGELEVLTRYAKAGISPSGKMRPTHIQPEMFALIDVPIILIYGERDPIFYKQRYIEFAKTAGWRLVNIVCDNHYIILRQPQEVSSVIKDFLGKH